MADLLAVIDFVPDWIRILVILAVILLVLKFQSRSNTHAAPKGKGFPRLGK